MAYYGPPGNYRSSLVGEANHGPPPNNNNVRPANAEATQILPYLFLGSSESASNRSLLQAFRVTHVLNMAKELPNYFDSCPDMNISYMRGDFSDFAFEDLLSFFPRGIQFISRAHDYAGGSGVVLVHCQAGKSRSASMVIAYLMYRYAYKLEDALAIVKTQRPIVDVFNFTHQLREFEQALERSDHYIMALECTANGLPFHPKPIEQITKQIPIRHSGSEQHSEAPSRIFLLNHTPDVPSSRFQPQPLSSAELNFANGPPPPPSYPRPPPGPPPAHALRVAIPTLLATSPRNNNNNNSNPYLAEEKRDAYNTAAPPDAFARKWAQMSAPVAPVSSSSNSNSAVALNAELPPLMARRLNKNKDAGVARIASLQLNPEFYSPSSSPPSSYTAAAIASPQPFSAPHVPDQLRAAQEAPVNNCCTIQ